MNRSLYIAATDMNAHQAQMDVISNNLTNVGTNGFKGSRAVMQDRASTGGELDAADELPSDMQGGTSVQQIVTESLYTQGNLTDRQLARYRHQRPGLLQVTMPDGSTAYTRDGSFQTNAQGQLVTSSGYLLNPAITIPQNTTNITVGSDGTVSVKQANSTTVSLIQIATFINPPGLDGRGENLFSETASSGAPNVSQPGLNGAGTLQQGYTEASNVNVVQELVNMIQTQCAHMKSTARP